MAIYVPPSTRRRRLVALVAAGLAVGLAIGFALGRGTSSGVDDALGDVRGQAEDAATALVRLPIEYEQALEGEGGESVRTIEEAIDRARARLDEAWADADWFGPAARRPVDAALDDLDAAAVGAGPAGRVRGRRRDGRGRRRGRLRSHRGRGRLTPGSVRFATGRTSGREFANVPPSAAGVSDLPRPRSMF